MEYKKVKIEPNAVTRNILEIEKPTGNIYESIMIIAKRANQISMEIKEDMQKELEKFASSTDNLEEIFENREQIDFVKSYEAIPKPTLLALNEFKQNKIHFRKAENNTEK
ncbi:MAG: DNA-directed RNA polymerase subunit omega [Bacteroidales bacterium]|jgi:DNA-directed RNA polymerase subunit K/omega|nr:DNA-directed RNA polymerase subunit omega [Bacteroidales bacterium]